MRRTSKGGSFRGATCGVGLAFAGLYVMLAAGCVTVRHGMRAQPTFSPAEPLKTYEMRQRAWTLGDQFVIEDECRRPAFFVKGKAFSVGDKLSFRDVDGNELVYISQKVLSLQRNYRIYRGDELFARVVKKLNPFRQQFVVSVAGAEDYRVRGNFWNYEYIFTRGGKKVAVVSKRPFAWPDAYRIVITADDDDVLILAAAVAIDLIAHDEPDTSVLPPWICRR
ncbi:MAG: LURP-one-related family protein [Candidatus Aminicenantes bacterium]|nr:LURP-one-related family protein [Candidatus Aminicenantes bacterium]